MKFICALSLLVLISSCFKKDQIIKPMEGPIIEAIYGLATVIPDKVYHVKTGVSLRVEKIFIKEGDIVQKNTPLISFDNGSTIRAPFDGTVVHLTVTESELTSPQTSLIQLQDLSLLYGEISLEQQSVMRIRKGQSVRISFESLRGKNFLTIVKSVYPREQNFIVRFDLPSEITGVLPGMTADVAIEVGRKEQAWLIPVKAVIQGHIKMDNGNGFKKTPVELGIIDGTYAEVIKPKLKGDEKIQME